MTNEFRVRVSAIPVALVFTPDVIAMVNAAARAWYQFDYTPCVTSGSEGAHGALSRHYQNRAVDFRTSDWPEGKRDEMLREFARELGPLYTWVLEADHLHVESHV